MTSAADTPTQGDLFTRVVNPRTDPSWAALTTGSQASLFTSPPWIAAISDTYQLAPEAAVAITPSGEPAGGFAWMRISDLRGDRISALPFSDRGDPLVADAATWAAVSAPVLESRCPITLRCLDGSPPTTDPSWSQAGAAAWHFTPTGDGIDALFAGLAPATRRNIKASRRSHLVVQRHTDADAVRAFHRLHVALRKYKYRLLAPPIELFEHIWEGFAARDGIVTVLATADGVPVAGAMYLVWQDVLYYKFGASLASHLALRPNEAIAWSALEWAVERGLRGLDWGLSDIDQPGLISYKRKWASTESRIVTLRAGDWPAACTMGPSRKAEADELLARLTGMFTDDAVPDHVTTQAGALLYRYFC